METATKQLVEVIRELIKHRSWKEVSIGEGVLESAEENEAAMRMSRTANNVWTLQLVRKTFRTVHETWFWT